MKQSLLFSILLITIPILGHTAPWVEVDDLSSRANIQYLADTGVINIPTTTYPLMWKSIAPSLENINLD